MSGARRGKRKRQPNAEAPAYRNVFQAHPLMLQRLAGVQSGGGDPHPNGTGSRFLEEAIKALAAGQPIPPALRELNANVEWAIEELFLLRDMG